MFLQVSLCQKSKSIVGIVPNLSHVLSNSSMRVRNIDCNHADVSLLWRHSKDRSKDINFQG